MEKSCTASSKILFCFRASFRVGLRGSLTHCIHMQDTRQVIGRRVCCRDEFG